MGRDDRDRMAASNQTFGKNRRRFAEASVYNVQADKGMVYGHEGRSNAIHWRTKRAMHNRSG